MDIRKIKEIADKRGVSLKQLVEETGIKRGTLFNYLGGHTPITLEAFFKIAKVLDVTPAELLAIVQNIEFEKEAEPVNVANANVMMVPLVNKYAYAGYLNGFGDEEYIEELPKLPYLADKEYKGNYVFFEVRGDSMDDGSYESYLEGDLILCREVRQEYWHSSLHIHKWDFVIVHKEEGILLKRIIKHDVEKGIIVAHSLNNYYPDLEIHLKDVSKLFNVVDVRRQKSRR